jgi:hypothetical protein
MGGDKGYRAPTFSVAIENVTQAWARNVLVKGKLKLRDMGYPRILSVHDEVKLYVPRTPVAVLDAADALIEVFGPGNDLGFGNAVVINPAEVTVCGTLWDPEVMPEGFWEALNSGDDSVLTNLP